MSDSVALFPPPPRAASPVSTALREIRRQFFRGSGFELLTARTIAEVFETAPVHAGTEVWRLPTALSDGLPFHYEFRGQRLMADQFAARTFTNALVIVKDGIIRHEHYANLTRPDSLLQSASMAKSLTALLAGIALDEGLISDLADPAENYLPWLSETAYAGVRLDDLLRMRSGVEWDDDFTIDGPARQAQEMSIFDNTARFVDAARWPLTRAAPPGTRFNYNTLDTAIVGRIVAATAGQSLASFTTERLWRPAGMQHDASWMLDAPQPNGHEFTGGGFNASARDYARLGQLILDKGQRDGRRIVSPEWVARMTSDVGDAEPGYGYGRFWWTVRGTAAVSANGGGGQYIYLDPTTRTVVVKLSHVPYGSAGRGLADAEPDDMIPLDSISQAFLAAASAWTP